MSLFNQIQRTHNLGTGYYYGGQFADLLYSCACYLMVADSKSKDALALADGTPDKWDANFMRLFGTDFGNPTGNYVYTNGVYQRQFEKGFVIAVEPNSPASISLTKPCTDAYTGKSVTTINLTAKQGGLYLY
jgi:hypothetical protein